MLDGIPELTTDENFEPFDRWWQERSANSLDPQIKSLIRMITLEAYVKGLQTGWHNAGEHARKVIRGEL